MNNLTKTIGHNLLFLFIFFSSFISAQKGSININVFDEFTKKPLDATVYVLGVENAYQGQGNIVISDLLSGVYSFEVRSENYKTGFLKDITIVPRQNLTYSIGLAKNSKKIEEVIISRKVYKTTDESPVSLRNLTSEEIQKNAGSNRDVSKAILSFPGVGSTATFRNDLFIRGGASSENRFYIDGIEVPVINHFQTQGSSGGPRGILTVDFIRDVDFYSGAFPANRNGVMSSLFEFHLRDARKDKIGYKAVIGLDDLQLMADGPLSKDQSWSGLFSLRKSNLQILFKALGLPFLPSYYDAQFKVKKKFKNGDELYFIGVGADDQFKFNINAEKTLANLTILDRLPKAPQWSYTIGTGYRHLADNGNWLFTISRNMLDNKAVKYFRNVENPENLLIDYKSQEIENKFRVDRNFMMGDMKVSTGAHFNYAQYFNRSFLKSISQTKTSTDDYLSEINLSQYGLYLQASQKLLNDRLNISGGFRLDASSYSKNTGNPLQQFSPRLSIHYNLNPSWALNFNTGLYYQLPAYTALGFSEESVYVNKPTLKYIRNFQVVGGVEYNGKNNLRFTAETYYKRYANYPFSIRNQISLANIGGDFGVVGPEPLDSRSLGRTYGLELLFQKRTLDNFYGIAAYTFGKSEFSDGEGVLKPTSWDSRHILALTIGKYFKGNWNLGARFRLQSGLPETPYDLERSQYVKIWNISNAPVQNYNLINSLRGNSVHQLDLRFEKKWIFSRWQFTAYLDAVNVYGANNPSRLPVVNLERNMDDEGVIINPTEPRDNQKYSLLIGEQDSIRPLPYLGVIFEF